MAERYRSGGVMAAARQQRPGLNTRSELTAALLSCRSAFIGVAVFSGIINVLMLTGSFYMLVIYDRVIPARSIATLIGLTALAAVLFVFLGIIDVIRARILTRIGAALDRALSARVFDALVRLPLQVGTRTDGLQALRDLEALRSFFSTLGPAALFDVPWIPLYLIICFILHLWIGVTATIGALVLVGLTMLSEVLTRGPTRAASGFGTSRNILVETSRRNAEALIAMGMTQRLSHRWASVNQSYLASQTQSADVTGGLGAIGRILRMMLQSLVIGVGAYLVIQQEATLGIIIAGSILAARALAPVDLAIGNWRGFVAARQAWGRLTNLLALLPVQQKPMSLLPPSQTLRVENVVATPPGIQKIVLQDVTFTLKAGNGLGIIGPSASGKSSLARLIVGIWKPVRGKVALDGAALDQWDSESLGQHVGYLPQDVELLSGTVAENIARFEFPTDPMKVIAAAQIAGVHEMILKLPSGYETQVGEQGTALSAGQRQRVALARALFGDPFLVVLDEPNSNLDAEGETALTQAITKVRARDGIVIVVAHRPSALGAIDQLLYMRGGRAQAFGQKEDVLARVLQRENQTALKVVSEKDKPVPTAERSAK